jgi:biopolymer transport protein TolQ
MPMTPVNTDVWSLVGQATNTVKFVLLVLVFASVFSWAVIFAKNRTIRRMNRENRRFLETFWASRSLENMSTRVSQFVGSSVANVFKSGFQELQKLPPPSRGPLPAGALDNVSRALARASSTEVAELERHVGWLATIANSSPFIGLFGTVWGIMSSFQGISARGSASLAVVAPGISEALVATATGLAAAIPAVVAYNHFVGQIRRAAVDMDVFSQDFLNLVQQSYLGTGRD